MNDDYWKFAEFERRFNESQATIRNLASTWMLAAFAAIALLLKSDQDVSWLVSPAVLVGVVSFMATMGLLVLWINDQLVYQRLLQSSFLIALKMEYDDKDLPPIRAMMMHSAEGKGMGRWLTYFYTIPMWCFLAVTFTAIALRQSLGPAGDTPNHGLNPHQSLAILVILCLAQAGVPLWVQYKRSSVDAKGRAALFGNKEFASMFEGTEEARARFIEVIARYQPIKTGEGSDRS